MLSGLVKEVSGRIKHVADSEDVIFLACASFEARTTAVVDKLEQGYRIGNSFVFKYCEKDRTNLRDSNFVGLTSRLRGFGEKVFPIICDHHDPLDGISKFKKLCENRSIELRSKDITIDMTTFTKQYLLVLLKFIGKQEPASVRLFYAEPEDYGVKWEEPLSYGLIDIVSVPTFGGHFYTEKESLLILLLGYEADRAYAVWERLSPHKTVILIGRPSFRETWEGRVEKINNKLISKLPRNCVHYIPTLDPFEVRRNLDSLIEQYSEKFNVAISPLGPKPQVVGCYLSASRHRDVQIVYAIPKFHNEHYFSKKVGKVWEYR